MNRTIYYKNLILFLLFVAVIFVAPIVFAQVSSPSLVRVNQADVELRHDSNANRVNTTLREGAVIRFPDAVVENMVYDNNGNINMAETIRVWHSLAAEDERLRPQRVAGRLVYPVKVLVASDPTYNIDGRASLGWVALGDFLRPYSFDTVRASEEIVNGEPGTLPPPLLDNTTEAAEPNVDVFFEEHEDEGFTETTSPLAPAVSLRPELRPADLDTTTSEPEPQPTTVMNPHANRRCENIRGRVAAALGSSINSRRVNCYLDLFHKETGCRHTLPQRAGNAGNPHAAYGLCSLEASPAIRRQNRRGPECVNINTVEQQTRCCAAIMKRHGGAYFGPVKIGVVDRCDR